MVTEEGNRYSGISSDSFASVSTWLTAVDCERGNSCKTVVTCKIKRLQNICKNVK